MTIDCPNCTGCGIVTFRTFEERCTSCGGSGIRPDHRLHDAPAVEVVAEAASAPILPPLIPPYRG
jgi:hypothetical protein